MARKKGPQVDEAVAYIQHKITNYEMAPGSSISDSAIAQELGMSRSPIREALLLLHAEGLVEYIDNKACVAPITVADIVEICQVASAVEQGALGIIEQNGGFSKEQKELLTDCFNKQDNAELNQDSNVMKIYEIDDAFHLMLVNFANNSRLLAIANKMRLQMQRMRWLNVVKPARRKSANLEHKSILDAILADDYAEAKEKINQHYKNTSDNLNQLLYSEPLRKALASIQFIELT